MHVESYQSPESVTDLYRSFQRLTVLEGTFNDTRCFQHLAILPLLESLNCTINSHELGQVDFTDQADCFPSLVRLAVGTGDLTALSIFFQHISSRNLQAVLIVEDRVVSVWYFKMLFDALAMSNFHTNLQELLVLRRPEFDTSSAFSEISSEALASLFPLSQLMILEITVDISVALDDGDLQNIAMAWPNLHTLCLVNQTVPPMPPRVTLKGLLRFTSRLPMKRIELSVDCAKLLNYAETGSIIPCPTLRHLNLCCSPILEHVDYIIAPLTLGFPSLSHFASAWARPSVGLLLSAVTRGQRDCWPRAVQRGLEPILAENKSCD